MVLIWKAGEPGSERWRGYGLQQARGMLLLHLLKKRGFGSVARQSFFGWQRVVFAIQLT
jgi:hypothetical protein